MPLEQILQVENLSKTFGSKTALSDVSFALEPGEVIGLLGPNGAGKSTLIKSIIGLLRPTSGRIFINGYPRGSREAKRISAYVPEIPQLYGMLTVWEHLQFIAAAYEVRGWEERAEELLQEFEILDQKQEFSKALSKGMRQKLSLCCGVISEAQILFFDEPMIGLDPKAIRTFKELALKLKEAGRTLFISTHLLDPIENICSRVIVLKKGKIIADGSLEELRTRLGGENASLEELFLEVTANA
ncbi:ABC transporter ATP-binding protein [Paradesulfitobacterium aromaticivorans]